LEYTDPRRNRVRREWIVTEGSPQKPSQPTFKVERQTFYTATLPNGRKAELKHDHLSVWTRSGEELVFQSQDVAAMRAMFDQLALDQQRSESK
jgi:hypothetical protein